MRGRRILALVLLLACGGAAVAPRAGAQAPEGAPTDGWRRQASQHLRKFKYYPTDPDRPQHRPNGTVTVSFAIDREGRLFTPVVKQSSGDAMLDSAAVVLMLVADPLPAPSLPAGQARMTVQLPVSYQAPSYGGDLIGTSPAHGISDGAWTERTMARLQSLQRYPTDPDRPDHRPSGTVVVGMTLDDAGRMFTPIVKQSSGDPMLDTAALALMLAANPFPPPPLPSGRKRVTVELPVSYRPASPR